MIFLLKNIVWAAIYLIIPSYYRTHGNKSLFSINLPYSVFCYLNVSFIHNTNSDCLTAFQVKNKNETLIINKLLCFKTIMS